MQNDVNNKPGCCGVMEGELPGKCAPMAFPYIPFQCNDPERYENKEALAAGTLFPGLNLPFKRAIQARMPAAKPELVELMALDFAVDELGLYLTTHPNDKEVLELYWTYIRMANEGREKYQKRFGPLMQTDITEGSYEWLKDPWPWDFEGSVR